MTTTYADNPQTEAAKKQYDAEKENTERIRAEAFERMGKGKPTPTQEELDMTMLGAHILHHEDDGSGPDPNQTRMLAPGAAGTYQTRQVGAQRPNHPAQHRPAPRTE